MILCLDIGNSHIFGGVFDGQTLLLRFRYSTNEACTSDQFGVFLNSVLRENHLNKKAISSIVACSVVPHFDYSLRAACIKYFSIEPFFLQSNIKTGLKIKYHNPLEVGADRIANAIAATTYYPKKNLLIADLGTTTTFCVVTKNNEYLGGAILPGMRLSMEVLQNKTAKLSSVEIIKPATVVGRTTAENIQSGLYYGQLAVIKEMIDRISKESFGGEQPVVIGTGGFSQLFEAENVFTIIIPDLVLQGLRQFLVNNKI